MTEEQLVEHLAERGHAQAVATAREHGYPVVYTPEGPVPLVGSWEEQQGKEEFRAGPRLVLEELGKLGLHPLAGPRHLNQAPPRPGAGRRGDTTAPAVCGACETELWVPIECGPQGGRFSGEGMAMLAVEGWVHDGISWCCPAHAPPAMYQEVADA